MDNVSPSEAPTGSLRRVLEHDHREIDGPIHDCADGSALTPPAKADLKRAVAELRRHIYTEEVLLFPRLRQAGMTGPIMVMLREHAQMWPILDTLDHGLADGVRDDELRTACHKLFILLQHHNPKEEQILYPQVDRVVDAATAIEVREFLDRGQVPADWTCQHLRTERGRG